MTTPRFLFGALLTAVLAGPVVLVTLETLRSPGGFSSWGDARGMIGTAANTLLLAGGAVLIAVPAGAIAAVLIERLPMPGRGTLRGLVVVGLFIPLPVYAVAWQVVLGTWLPPLTLEPGEVAWRPWAQGLMPAAWVHGAAGLPWVVWIVGAGLRSTDPGLEETALLEGGPNAVLRRVLLPRAALGGLAAAGWVAVQTGTEIIVTDAMMVRTFAEEVYTQFVVASEGLAGAVAVAVPAWLLSVGIAVLVARPVSRIFGEPPSDAGSPASLKYSPRVRAVASVLLWAGAIAFAGLPLAALVWKAGGGGTRLGWDAASFAAALAKQLRVDGGVLAGSAGAAAVAGVIAAGLAWVACRAAGESQWFARFLFVLCIFLWVTPGPLVGLGLKDAINTLLDAEDRILGSFGASGSSAILRPLLYDRPSPVPATWAAVIRLFPVAVAVLWPSTRAIPRELRDAAKLDGLGVGGTWRRVVVPLTGPAAARAAVAVAALALGEVSAGKLVNPPGRSAYVLRLFDQMHYGAESTVAALGLLQIAATASAAVLLLRRSEYSFSPGRARTG